MINELIKIDNVIGVSINKMEKLIGLYNECINELKSIGIDVDLDNVGEIDISFAKRNTRRYGCCKYEEPDKKSYYKIKRGHRTYIKFAKYNKHHIEISKWVMELDESIIKNTIIHELIHCMPYCVDHGEKFKAYANIINSRLGYNITRLGDKEADYKKSNVEYTELKKQYNYKIICNVCGLESYRIRIAKNFTRNFRCAKCGGGLEVYEV